MHEFGFNPGQNIDAGISNGNTAMRRRSIEGNYADVSSAKQIISPHERRGFGMNQIDVKDRSPVKLHSDASSSIDMEKSAKNSSLWRYNSLFTQVVMGLVCFCCPDMFNSLNGMEGGGQVNHSVSNSANTALYIAFTVFGVHEGGVQVVEHGREIQRFHFAGHSHCIFYHVTFCIDCLHELKEEVEDCLLSLAFNVMRKNVNEDSFMVERLSQNLSSVEAVLKSCLEQVNNNNSESEKLVVLLSHQYIEATLSFAGLKGRNHFVAEVLGKYADNWLLDLHLCLLQKHDTYTRGNPFEENETESKPWISRSDKTVQFEEPYTGMWPESASLRDFGLGPVPAKWKGACLPGARFIRLNRNKKLVGARYYFPEFQVMNGPTDWTKEYQPARDTLGHGTRRTSTAARSTVHNVSMKGLAKGTARGMAPHARPAAHKVCEGDGNTALSDVLAAIDQVMVDGVKVVSLSLTVRAQTSYDEDLFAVGAFGAMSKGVFVAATCNDRPNFFTVATFFPWMMTFGTQSLYNSRGFYGRQIPFVYAGINYVCMRRSLYPRQVKGKIVLCESVVISGVDKSKAVVAAIGAGMIVMMNLEGGKIISPVSTEEGTITLACTRSALWAGCDASLNVWNIQRAMNEASNGKRNQLKDVDADKDEKVLVWPMEVGVLNCKMPESVLSWNAHRGPIFMITTSSMVRSYMDLRARGTAAGADVATTFIRQDRHHSKRLFRMGRAIFGLEDLSVFFITACGSEIADIESPWCGYYNWMEPCKARNDCSKGGWIHPITGFNKSEESKQENISCVLYFMMQGGEDSNRYRFTSILHHEVQDHRLEFATGVLYDERNQQGIVNRDSLLQISKYLNLHLHITSIWLKQSSQNCLGIGMRIREFIWRIHDKWKVYFMKRREAPQFFFIGYTTDILFLIHHARGSACFPIS